MSDASEGLPLADDVVGHAVHGSYCPKLCSHACPVLEATGRPDSVPWSFHRTVADLAAGRLEPGEAAPRLEACTGCGACAGGCTFEDQDVPAQVRAGRAAVVDAGAAPEAVGRAVELVEARRSPFGVDRDRRLDAAAPTVWLVAGCRDDEAVVAAAVRLLGTAGESTRVVTPPGCCGATLRDLGAVRAADDARAALVGTLTGAPRVVLLDPHCRPEVTAAVGPDVEVVDLVVVLSELVDDGLLELGGGPAAVRWHEPCLLADTPAAGVGSALLADAGSLVELPGEAHHGCSGGGMALELLAPATADEVAAARTAGLAGPGPLVTGCAGAARRLAGAGTDARHLVTLLASLLDDDPESVA